MDYVQQIKEVSFNLETVYNINRYTYITKLKSFFEYYDDFPKNNFHILV